MTRRRDSGRPRPPSARPGRRRVSDAETDLWRQVTQSVTPLETEARARRARPDAGEAGPEQVAEKAPPGAGKAKAASKAKPPAARRPAPPPPPPRLEALTHGSAAGVDKRTAARLRRGQIQPEARIDLHGHTLAEAHPALDAFLEAASASGVRCVLVITGRGLRAGAEEGVMRKGVLREKVPAWLNEPPNRARILSFCHAQPKDGGAGALYVLLKKKR